MGKLSLTKAVTIFVVVSMSLGFIWLLLPEPEMNQKKPLNPQELKELLGSFQVSDQESYKNFDEKQLRLAKFGRTLFFDARLSANNQISCAFCHQEQRAFTDGLPVAQGLETTVMNTPTIMNSGFNHWFFWDGRADSLESQAIGPLENPKEHGFSRSKMVRVVMDHHREAYEENFGPIPEILERGFALEATAPNLKREMSVEIAAYVLQTLDDFELLQSLLKKAREKNSAPAIEFIDYLYRDRKNPETVKLWLDQAPEVNEAINQVTVNFSRAVAAYQRGIIGIESPFDQFLQRYLSTPGLDPTSSFVDGFGEKEFKGLELFTGTGNCVLCHTGPNFTDQQFHNIGLAKSRFDQELAVGRSKGVIEAMENPFNCLGTYFKSDAHIQNQESCAELPWLDTELLELLGAFKTPSLRNVAQTAPYFHDGRAASLDDVLFHYNFLHLTEAIGHREESLVPLEFNQLELDSLKAFLESLNSPIYDVSQGKYLNGP